MQKELPVIPFGEQYPLFDRISIETLSQCTRKCSFCPLQFRDKKLNYMSMELYEKIALQLEAVNFSGTIQWFYLNEPLMDKQRFTKLLMLPKNATIHITSNGDTIKNYEAFEFEVNQLFECGVNSLNFNVYDDSKEHLFSWVSRYVMKYRVDTGEHCWKPIKHQYLSASDMRSPKHLHNWTGAFDFGNATELKCSRPARHLVVQYDGKIPLCCAQDPTRGNFESFGDANKESLVDIWNNKMFFQYRWNLQNQIRIGQCTGCNEIVKGSCDIRRVSL